VPIEGEEEEEEEEEAEEEEEEEDDDDDDDDDDVSLKVEFNFFCIIQLVYSWNRVGLCPRTWALRVS